MRLLLILAMIGSSCVLAGCETWSGVKKDTQKGWDATKGAIHKATQ